jgi:hypothetical protein
MTTHRRASLLILGEDRSDLVGNLLDGVCLGAQPTRSASNGLYELSSSLKTPWMIGINRFWLAMSAPTSFLTGGSRGEGG